MLRPASMLRLRALVLSQDERAALQALGRREVMHLIRTEAGPDTAPLGAQDRSADLTQCDRLLARVADVRRILALPPPAAPADAKWSDRPLCQVEAALAALETRAQAAARHHQALLQQDGELRTVIDQVASYRDLELPLDDGRESSYLHVVTGTLPAENLVRLQAAVGGNVLLLPLPGAPQPARIPLLALTSRPGREALEQALRQTGFTHAPLPSVAGARTDTLSDRSERERQSVATALAESEAALRALADELASPLAGMLARIHLERRLLAAERHFPRTAAAVLLTGWIPEHEGPDVMHLLRQATDGRCVLEASAPQREPEDTIPVLLRQHRLLRPFSMFVTGYGLPQYHELEPTLFVAISYVLMFGIMFADAGHGAVLALGGVATRLAGRAAKVRDAGLLLLCCGLSSTVFGVVYGSYFGLPSLKHHALWHDPLEGNPLSLMAISVAFGVVMISLGLVLNTINRFRRGDRLGGCLDKYGLAGIWFYWGALALALNATAIRARGLLPWATLIFLGLPVLAWALTGPLRWLAMRRGGDAAEGSLSDALTEAFAGAFEAVLGYLSNTVSFVRLAAYAMSHAALLMAAYVVASEVRKLPFGGDLMGLLVIVAGNLFALLLEGIVASVQALRLEYYEFFGKFFSGSGQPFRPFRLTADG